MFDKTIVRGLLAVALFLAADAAMADFFGMGANQFAIDFVPISGATNPISGYGIVNNTYRTGATEITNDQWSKFKAAYGTVTGSPSEAYDNSSYYTGTNVPTNVSWYEAAQFVNWLNTSTSHQAAYKFTGAQGTSDYTLDVWSVGEAANGTNLYRHKDAFYFLPTEDEWVKAAYWNGAALQTYATKAGESLMQGDGTSGSGWNYYDGQFATDPSGPWNAGSGRQELNGTYEMMGNVWEWIESPWTSGDYDADAPHGLRGACWYNVSGFLASSDPGYAVYPTYDCYEVGFRVASVPEPSSLAMLAGIALTALLYNWRKRA